METLKKPIGSYNLDDCYQLAELGYSITIKHNLIIIWKEA